MGHWRMAGLNIRVAAYFATASLMTCSMLLRKQGAMQANRFSQPWHYWSPWLQSLLRRRELSVFAVRNDNIGALILMHR